MLIRYVIDINDLAGVMDPDENASCAVQRAARYGIQKHASPLGEFSIGAVPDIGLR